MIKKCKKGFSVSLLFFVAFIVWTVLISNIDTRAIGPRDSIVGFATLNGWFHNLTGVHMSIYNITDWLGLVPVAFMFGFAVFGLVEWIKRKNILKVDFSILALGVYYILVFVLYLLFESVVINYRPVLINDFLEASYPSSTTLLVMSVMPTAIFQFSWRNKNRKYIKILNIIITVFMVLMVVGRLISGVHWITDIIGGLLLSASLVTMYYSVVKRFS